MKLLCGWSLCGRIRYVNRRLLFVLDVLSTERSDWKDGLSLIGSYVNQSENKIVFFHFEKLLFGLILSFDLILFGLKF